MLRLNLVGLSDFELKRLVAERCSGCGSVKRVDFYRLTDRPEQLMALVDMSSEEELNKVLAQLNASDSGIPS